MDIEIPDYSKYIEYAAYKGLYDNVMIALKGRDVETADWIISFEAARYYVAAISEEYDARDSMQETLEKHIRNKALMEYKDAIKKAEWNFVKAVKKLGNLSEAKVENTLKAIVENKAAELLGSSSTGCRETVYVNEIGGISEIAEMAGVTGAAVINWTTRKKDFPKPIAELRSGKLYNMSKVEAWLEKHNKLGKSREKK